MRNYEFNALRLVLTRKFGKYQSAVFDQLIFGKRQKLLLNKNNFVLSQKNI
jgi:hypothetical protein